MPGRVPVFLHGGNPQEAYTMPHAYLVGRVENQWETIRKQKEIIRRNCRNFYCFICQSIARGDVRKAS